MQREAFAARFLEAARRARDFAQTFVVERLPDDLLFRVRLNSSYDAIDLLPAERVFPADSAYDRAFALRRCEFGAALDALWRDGWVPEWINLSAIDRRDSATVVEVVSCGRFTQDEALLLHVREGLPPFHVLGPAQPRGYEQGQRFSIHHSAECWDPEDLRHLARVPSAVESLELCADGASLASITLERLPDRNWGCAALARAVPNARRIELGSEHPLRLDGGVAAEVVELALRAPRLEGHLRLPSRLESVSLRLGRITAERWERLFDGVERVRALHLRGTPISDELARSLPGRWRLEFLDLVDTGVRRETIDAITRAAPDLRLLSHYEG